MVDRLIDTGQRPPGPDPARTAQRGTKQGNRHDQLEIMQRHFPIGIAECLDQPDLLALCLHHAADHDVQKKGRNRHEDRRNRRAGGAQASDFLGQEPIGELIRQRVGPQPAKSIQNRIHRRQNRLGPRTPFQRQQHLVERALEVECRFQRVLIHPQNRKARIVRHHLARRDREQEFRGLRDSDNAKLPTRAVHGRRQAVAQCQTMGLHKALQQKHFLCAPRLRHPPVGQIHTVQPRLAPWGQRYHLRPHRNGLSGDLDKRLPLNAPLHRVHTGNLGDPIQHLLRCPHHRCEDIRQPVALVIGTPGFLERRNHAAHHHQQQHTHRNHQRNRPRLALDPPEVSQQLVVQGAHVSTRLSRPG